MTTKVAVKPTEHLNGDGGPAFQPTIRKISGFQFRYLKRLIDNFERAREAVNAAQMAANDFIVACGEEEGIRLGVDGWQFDSDKLEFFQVTGGGDDGDNSRSE